MWKTPGWENVIPIATTSDTLGKFAKGFRRTNFPIVLA